MLTFAPPAAHSKPARRMHLANRRHGQIQDHWAHRLLPARLPHRSSREGASFARLAASW